MRSTRPGPHAHRALWTAAGLGLAVAAAVALRETSFHVVPSHDAVWRGILDLPSTGRLAAAAVAGALVAALLSRRPVGTWRPLLALGVALLPLVPVLTGQVAILLAFQGAALAFVGLAAAAVALARQSAGIVLPAGSGVARFVAAFLFYAALGTRLPGPAGPQGDEPHYLTMAQSLLSDRDLDLTDEFRDREYAPFFAGELRPHTSPASPPGKLYPLHTPGLPALILPAYALAGYPGVLLFLSAVAALAAALSFRLVRETTGDLGAAWAAWGVLAFTPPLPFYALAVYPETLAAAATAGLLLLARADATPARALAAGLLATALPWLHPKFLPLSALGLGLVLLRRGPRAPRLAAFVLAAVSLAALLLFFERHYGSATLSAAYGPGFASDVSLGHVPRGALALLLDRQFGLLSVSPVWALALPGAALLLRDRPGAGLAALALGGASFGVGASFSMWWGGSCPPARFLVPALPALALLLAPALGRRRDLAAALGGLGLAVVALAGDAPRALHNRDDGGSALLRVLVPSLDLDAALPSFVVEQPAAPVLALALAAAFALVWLHGRRGLAAAALAYALLSGGLRDTPLLDARTGTLRLLAAWDPERAWSPWAAPSLEGTSVPLDMRRSPWVLGENDSMRTRPIDLPPGRYRLEWSGHAGDAAAARLEVGAGRLGLAAGPVRAGDSRGAIEVPLVAGARRLVVAAQGRRGTVRVDALRLVPEALVPRSRRDEFRWPRVPDPDRYRAGAGSVLTTALDRSSPEAGGFRLDGARGAFLVEVPEGGSVLLRLLRRRPTFEDSLHWGDRRFPLRGPAAVTLILDAADGLALGSPARVVPVRVESEEAWIRFEEAPPG